VYKAAVQRCDSESVLGYVQLPAVRNASTVQLQQLLQLSLQLCRTALRKQDRAVGNAFTAVEGLCSLPQAKQLSPGTVAELVAKVLSIMNQATAATPLLDRKLVAAAELLLQLPAAAVIPASDLARLCGCVVEQCSDDRVADELLQLLQGKGSLPGTEQLASLITACLQNREDESAAACILLLCSDPAAQHVTVSTVQQLLLEAVGTHQLKAMQALVHSLPLAAAAAINGLSNEQAQQLLQAIVSAILEYRDSVQLECCLPWESVENSWLETLESLVEATANHGIRSQVLLHLVEQAVAQEAADIVQQLVKVKSCSRLGKSNWHHCCSWRCKSSSMQSWRR
jgi:hypothetical protein